MIEEAAVYRDVRYIMEALAYWSRSKALPSVLLHGDYKPSNIRLNRKGGVTGMIDWERCRPNAIPGLDAVTLVVVAFSKLYRMDSWNLLEGIWGNAQTDTVFDDYSNKVMKRYGLSRNDLFYISVFWWLENLRWTVDRNYVENAAFKKKLIRPVFLIMDQIRGT